MLFCSSLVLFSCKNEITKNGVETVTTAFTDSTVVDIHNSQNALDWSGAYKGVTPCADCEGIDTETILDNNLTFVIRTKYLGKEDRKVFVEKGAFEWDKTGSFFFFKRN